MTRGPLRERRDSVLGGTLLTPASAVQGICLQGGYAVFGALAAHYHSQLTLNYGRLHHPAQRSAGSQGL